MTLNNEIVKVFQQRLQDLGWYSGPIDGIAGTQVDSAITRFCVAAGISSSYGPIDLTVMSAVFDEDAPSLPVKPSIEPKVEYSWMEIAQKRMGIKEIPGVKHNPVIMQWAKNLGVEANYRSDEVSWCGLFVGDVIKTALPNEKLPSNVLGARQWLTFGVEVTPSYGAVMVFWRGSPQGWHGHVAFYVGEDDKYYYVIGGNQSNSVNIAKILKSRLLGARAPKTAKFTEKKSYMSSYSPVSKNEA